MRLFIFFLVIGAHVIAQNSSQNSFQFYLEVKTTKGLADAGREVVFIETNTYERLAFKTNTQGKLSVTFDHGRHWLGSVGEMRNCIDLETWGNGNSSQTMTYNPEGFKRENQILPDRRSLQFNRISQHRIYPGETPTAKESIVTIVLQGRDKKPHAKVDVQLVCFATQTIYESTTNANGAALFKLPIDQNYEIDIDDVESLKWIDLGSHPMQTTMHILYEPRTFTEKDDGRFIIQTLPLNIEPSSSHARVKLKIREENQSAVQEDVYVRMLKSNKVYKAKTNDQGEVTFMLPVKGKYLVDFTYQRDAGEIDLSHVKGIAFEEMTVNYIPDPRLKNIEDFIPSVKELIEYDVQNFIDKQYPEPVKGDIDFYLKWGNKFNANSKEAVLEVGMKVKSNMTRKSADPLNICFVIDKSGSMMGEDRLEQVKRSLIDFIKQLNADDVVSIVVFESMATLAVPAEKIGDKKKIIDIIYAIQSDGGTNIYDGMILGFEEVKKNLSPSHINRLMLLTDGYGSNPPEMVIEKAKTYIKQGIELSAIGVGADYNMALLSQLASAGGGLLHLAGTTSNIQDVFQKELESILYPMAKEATLTVRYNNQIIYRQLFGYANEKVVSGKMSVEIPHLFPGLDQMALIKFDLLNPTPEIVKEEVIVTLEYTDAITGKPVVLKKSIHPEWMQATGALDMSIDKEHQKILAIANVNQLLKVMANSFETGDQVKAEEAVKNAYKQIQDAYPNAKPEDVIAIIDRLKFYVDAFETLRLQGNNR